MTIKQHAGYWCVAAITAALSMGTAVQPERAPQPPSPRQQGPGPNEMAGMLMAGLRATPGCLHADAGQFQTGKSVIIGWFENKAAVQRWYNSPAHRGMIGRFVDGDVERVPLEHVTDETVPVMVMASLSFDPEQRLPGVRLPISQIAIELFAPLPGGAYINGRLAPDGFEVPHMRNLAAGADDTAGN